MMDDEENLILRLLVRKWAYLETEEIAKAAGRSRKEIAPWLERLVANGYLTRNAGRYFTTEEGISVALQDNSATRKFVDNVPRPEPPPR
jgi:predicted transcriptional regulator